MKQITYKKETENGGKSCRQLINCIFIYPTNNNELPMK